MTAVVVCAAAGLFLARTGRRKAASPPSKSMDRYTIAYEIKFEDFDPHSFTSYAKYVILRQIFETLVRVDDSLNVVPGLAEKWSIDRDAGEITFYLRSARFHDGSPVTALDVRDSLRRAARLGALQRPSDVITAVDERTLKIKMSSGAAEELLRSLTLIYAGVGKASTASANGFVGSGPYRLASYDAKSGAVDLEQFNGYYRTVLQPRRLEFRWVSTARIHEAFERGEVDEFDTNNYPLDGNATAPGRKVALYFPMTRFLVFNLRSNVFRGVENRRAFVSAWPKKSISKELYPFSAPATGLIPKGLLGHLNEEDARLPPTKRDLKEEVTIGTGNASEASVLEKELARHAPGLRVRLRVYALQERIIADITNGSLDGRIFGNSPKDFDARSLLATFTSGHPVNIYGIKDAGYDAIIDSLTGKDEVSREAALKKADRHLLQQAYLLPLSYTQSYRIVHQDCPDAICGDHFQIWDRQYVGETP